ncbi:tape measure protein [Mycobacterium phage Whirlwind]|uniref:Tape measure protein n=1 Tax=Mycobacterium phage Whirlwind TaxID=1340826 RepID=S5YAI4_9CAUD|nr:tail length tape measure protein [Mycobacterium phage Whirlwind]AGT12625.1 tape measure protein [Mycobacterium phage Whirlwind]
MAEFVAAQASVLIVPTLGKGANSFHTKLKAELQKVRESVDVQVNADTTRMMAEVQTAKKALEADPINLRVAVDNDGFKTLIKDVQHIQTVYQDLKSDFKKGLYLNLKVVGLSTLNMAALAIGSLNTSLVELAQSSLVVPGIMAGLASSLTAGIVGSRGLADAFKAQATATKNATDSARQQRDANKAVRDSTRDLNNAIKDAKRNLQDLNDQLRDAPLDEAEAMMNLAEAQAEANNRLGKSAFDLQRDQLRLRRAENELADTRKTNGRLAQDVAEANVKGIQGNDAVVAATERLTAALEDQKRGADAVSDLADAMARLSPAAQDFVNKVKALGGAWDDLRFAVQDRLFAGLGDDVTTLAGTSLPMLKSGLTDIAGAINGTLRTAIASLGSQQNQGFLENIFGNTADAQRIFDQAVNPLIGGLLRLSSVGSDSLPRLSDAFGDVMTRFENFITRADENGNLDKWIDQGLTALTELGNTLLNIGSIMNTVSEAFTGAGGKSVTEWLETNTKRLADFLKGPEGQQKLRDIFANARAEFSKWEPVLKTIPGIIKNIADAAQNWANIVLPFLNTVAPILRDHPGLVMAIFTAYMTWRTAFPVIRGLNTLIGTDTGLVGAAKRAGKSIGEGQGLSGKLRAFGDLIGPGGLVMGGLTVLAGFLINDWVNAQQRSADAVQHHADMVALLKGNIDSLSGSMTQQGLVDTINGLSSWQDPRGNRRDIPMIARDQGLTDQFTRAVNPTDQAGRNQFSQSVREALRQELGPKLKETVDGVNHEAESRGESKRITEDDLLNAILGGPQTRLDFSKNNYMRETLDDFIFGKNDGPLGLGNTPGLSKRAQDLIALNAATNEAVDSGLAQGQLNRDLGRSLAGANAEFLPGGPFSQLGSPRAFYNINRDGGATIEVDTPPDRLPPELVEQLGDYNITPLAGNSGSSIKVDPDLAKQFLQPQIARAAGGILKGPGSGTSDSILARVSNGEFVLRAAAVEKYGTHFLDALNAGALGTDDLPGFWLGGLIGGPKTDTPGPFPNPNPTPGPNTIPMRVSVPQSGPDGFLPAIPGAPFVPNQPFVKGPSYFDLLGPLGPGGAPGGAQVVGTPSVTQYKTATPAPAGVRGPAPSLSGPQNPGLYDPVTGTYTPLSSSSGNVPKPGRDGDPGETPGPNLPPTDAKSPFNPQTHGSGASPGPGNGVPHLTGATPGPGSSASLVPSVSGLTPSANDPLGLSGLPDNLQPVSILEQVGEVLLSAVLGFFGIDPTYFNIGKKVFTGLTGKKDDTGDQKAAVPGVDDLMAADPYAYYGVGMPGTADLAMGYGPAATRAASMAAQMQGKPYVWGGSTLDGTDCSGMVMYVVDAFMGNEFKGRSGGTGGFSSTVPAKGGVIIDDPSEAPPGTLRIGWNASHTAGTLPDGRNFESSTYGKPIAVGAGASGYNDPQFTNWAYFAAPGYAAGGLLRGPGNGTSDSILARLSDGEFVTRASVVSRNPGLFTALNSGALDPAMFPKFADGTPFPLQIAGMQPQTPQQAGPLPPPVAPMAGPPGPDPQAQQSQPPVTDTAAQAVGDGISGVLGGTGVAASGATPGAEGPEGANPEVDPRSILGAAPTKTDHNNPALSKGIQGAFSTVGSIASMAAAAAMSAGTMGAGAAAAGPASSGIQAGAQMAGQIASGALNVLSSLLVGTAPGQTGTTANAYGAPVLPQGPPQSQPRGPGVVNNYGDIHTANYEEFHRGQQRREAQTQAPFLPMR